MGIVVTLLALLQVPTEEATTEHYQVISTYRNREFVRNIADRLEAAYPVILKLLDSADAEGGRYRLRLYATQKEYAARDQELNDGRFSKNGAFSHPETGEAYILIQPRAGVPLLDRTQVIVAHEAFHIVAYRCADWLKKAPAWLTEGLAERAAELTVVKSGGDSVAATLKFGSAAAIVQRQIERRGWIPLDDLLAIDGSGDPDFITRWTWYAEAWLLIKYLSEKRPDAWREFLARMTDAEVKIRGAARTRTVLLQSAGRSMKELEEAWIGWIRALKPAPWTILDGDWRLTPEGVEGASFPEWPALLVSTERVKAEKFILSAEAWVEEDGSGQVDLAFVPGWELRGRNLWKVSISRKPPMAALLVRKNDEWTLLAHTEIDPKRVPSDRWIKLALEREGKSVRFRVDGEVLVEHKFEDPDVELQDVNWGVGTYDSWARFREIRLTRK